MNDESTLKMLARTPATDEVLRRVGRNLVTFQQIERILKALVSSSRFRAPASQFAERFAKHASKIDRRTMGTLAAELVDSVMQPRADEQLPEVVDEVWLGFTFSVEMDAQATALHDTELKELVARRNDLVHHFLPHWQTAANGDVEPALAWLDAQHEAAIAMLDRLNRWIRTIETGIKEGVKIFASEIVQVNSNWFSDARSAKE